MRDYPAQYEVRPLGPGGFDATGANAVRVPGSKSMTNRALPLAALAEGATTLTGVLFADDTRRMIEALGTLGFELKIDEDAAAVTVRGGGGGGGGDGGTIPNAGESGRDVELLLGNAGTAMRFLTAACTLGEPGSSYRLDGIPRMRKRPIGELVDLLRELGARIDYLGEEGFPPLRVHGGLPDAQATAEIPIGATLSSQYVSALLLIAPRLRDGLTIRVAGKLTSFPYVRMTVGMMNDFGANVSLDDPDSNGVPQRMVARHARQARYGRNGAEYRIEPDASNASYFLAAAAVNGRSSVEVRDLSVDGAQGDAGFAGTLEALGAEVDRPTSGSHPWIRVTSPRGSHASGSLCLRGQTCDLADMPDMAQTLAVVALFADGPTTIRNVGNLRVKETDRLAALENELTKLGATVTIDGDDITITPPTDDTALPFTPGEAVAIDTYDDHRMAMSFAVAGLASDRLPGRPRVVINDPGCVAKTYPGFWDDLRRYLGAEVVKPEKASP